MKLGQTLHWNLDRFTSSVTDEKRLGRTHTIIVSGICKNHWYSYWMVGQICQYKGKIDRHGLTK